MMGDEGEDAAAAGPPVLRATSYVSVLLLVLYLPATGLVLAAAEGWSAQDTV